MKILLINNNPVVSRLTALSARKEDIEIDEIQEVTELSSDKYDIVFVDADSWSKDVDDIIADNIKVQKRVLFYAQDDKEGKGSFDLTILKPFLPSEVSAVIRSVEEHKVEVEEPYELEEEKHFNILDQDNDEKRDELFSLDINKEEKINTELNAKQELTSSALENELEKIDVIASVDSFDKKLEDSFPLKTDEFDAELFEKEDLKTEIKKDELLLKNEDDLFELDLNDDKLSLDNDLFSEDKKSKENELDNDLLDFDFENNDEFDFGNEEMKEVKAVMSNISEDEVKKEKEEIKEKVETKIEETKILDGSEIANIKDILEDKQPDDSMSLDDLMTTSAPAMAVTSNLDADSELKVEKKKKSKKVKNGTELHSDVLLETLTSLPIESLRELLSGAKVNISIKFPKVK